MNNNIIKLQRTWNKNDLVEVEFPMEISTSRWFEGSVAIERGPLLYALKIQEKWEEKKEDEWVDTFYEVLPESPWNYGIPQKTLDNRDFSVVVHNGVSDMPWNLQNAPLSIYTKGKLIPYWNEYNGNTGKIPVSTWPNRDINTEEERIELIPYGCTTLRISQFPVVEVHKR